MQTLQNGIKVFTNGDDYNLADDMEDFGLTSNVIIPVVSEAQRNALTDRFIGMTVRRLDVAGSMEYWDGTQWIPELISTIWSNTGSTVTTAGGGPGPLTLEAGISQNPSFITSPGAGQLRVARSGAYSITWNAGGLGMRSGYMAIKNSTATGTYVINNFPPAGEQSVCVPNLYLSDGAIITFVLGPSDTVTIGSTIRMTKIA